MIRAFGLRLRLALPALAAGLCATGLGQNASPAGQVSPLPATPATGLTARTQAAIAPAQSSSRRAEVRYADGLLTVTARDSSLNAILHDIAQQTGMKISGGVREERVFGSYGPDQPSAVLSALLDGCGSNMLLVNNTANQPAQLILTPRTGGPTPPGEFAANRQQQESEGEDSVLMQQRFGGPGPPSGIRVGDGPSYAPGVQAGPNLNPSLSPPTTNNSDSQAVVFPAVSATTTPATATTSSDVTQEAPGGIKTPQQIFEQLQRLRQQQEQTTPQETTPPQ